ncbi:MAG: hypothetical protein Q9195_003103 [Heterodermia aff. obscurata]
MSAYNDPILLRVTDALKPFIRDRKETLRIRRILSVYLASMIGGSDESLNSPISISALNQDLSVQALPRGLSGIRKEYLLALQANVEARKSYERTSQKLSLITRKKANLEQRPRELSYPPSASSLLELSQLQHRYERLKIIQGYLSLLRRKEPANEEYLSISSIRPKSSAADDNWPAQGNSSEAEASETDVQSQSLITRLEKAVLGANESVKREKRLFEEFKVKHLNLREREKPPHHPQATRAHALARARDELVAWMEQMLAKVDTTEGDSQIDMSRESQENLLDIEKRREDIQKTYQDYLEVRKSLVGLLSRRRNIPEVDLNDIRKESKDPGNPESNHKKIFRHATNILPYVTEYLIPVADAQEALLHQDGHLSNGLNVQKVETTNVLDRLGDESHLLADYPSLASQPHFKDTVTGLKTPGRSPSPFEDGLETTMDSKIVGKARLWACAAGAARTASHADLNRRLWRGEERATAAEETLEELQELIGVNDSEADDHNDHDLWNPNVKVSNGVWSGLDGNVRSTSAAR